MTKLPAKETQGIFTVHRRGLEADVPTTPILIMVSGFPDAVSTWDPLLPHLEPHFHLVPMAFPGMDPDDIPRLEAERYWGYSLDEVSQALLAVIQKYRDAGCTTIYLLGHDWGAFPVLKIAHEYPTAVTAVVSEDIGLNSIFCPTSILYHLAYQVPLVAIFLLSRIVPGCVASLCRNVLQRCCPWEWCGPLSTPLRHVVMRPTYHLYPYYTVYRGMWHKRELYPLKFTKAPLLYLYGKQKPILLHSKLYMQKLEQRSDCRSIAYDGAGHWLHTSHPQRMAHDMMQFFQNVAANNNPSKTARGKDL